MTTHCLCSRHHSTPQVEAMCRIAKHPNIIDFYATTSQKEFIPRYFIIIGVLDCFSSIEYLIRPYTMQSMLPMDRCLATSSSDPSYLS